MAGDPYFENVSLLLHMDGSNGSTTFTDSSNAAHTMVKVGSPTISTAQGKFNQSLLMSNFADGLYLVHNDLIMGTADYTIEMFVYQIADNTSGNALWDIRLDTVNGTPGITAHLRHPGFGNVPRIFNGATSTGSNGSTVFNLNTWYHFALVRESGTAKLYIDGVLQVQIASVENYTGNNLAIGILSTYLDSGYGFKGYIDDFRITKGIARYTANFTPPTAAFLNYAGQISGTLSESLAATDFKAHAHDLSGNLVNATTVTAGAYSIDLGTLDPVTLTMYPDIGTKWAASTAYALGDKVFPTDPATTPYYYECTTAGTTGTTEPTWPTSAGTVNDGTAVWTFVEQMVQPITQGPLIPS